MFLEAHDIRKEWNGQAVLNGISFTLKQGMRLGIAGETGSGKTSLLEILGGRGQADSGLVLFRGNKVPGTMEKLVPGHPGISYTSQHFELPPHYWIREILEYASDMNDQQRHRLYQICRIQHLLDRRTNQLSGGERQRVSLARELSSRPQLLLMDEPFSNLDAHHKRIMKDVLQDVSSQLGITQILVSHDAADLLPWADALMILKKGAVVQSGSSQEVYENPASLYVAGLLGEYNLVDPHSTVFASLPFGKKAGSDWLLRPEDIIATDKDPQFQAIVKQVEYRGHFAACRIDIQGEELIMYSRAGSLNPGDKTGVRILKVSPVDRHF